MVWHASQQENLRWKHIIQTATFTELGGQEGSVLMVERVA
jgi:hypothetical protein